MRAEVQVRFVAMSAKTEDDATNTWHFTGVTDPMPTGTSDLIRDALKTFYSSLATSILNDWDSSHVIMKFYRLEDARPRAPYRQYDVALTAAFSGSASPWPRQASPVLSYAAAGISGVPMARRRGRVYLPTFNSGSHSGAYLASAAADSIATAANVLKSTSDIATDWKWVVRSKVSGSDATVAKVWCDNSIDIVRRRKRDATYRKTLP